jgi:hypothetical protein
MRCMESSLAGKRSIAAASLARAFASVPPARPARHGGAPHAYPTFWVLPKAGRGSSREADRELTAFSVCGRRPAIPIIVERISLSI